MKLTPQLAEEIVNTYIEGFARKDVDMIVDLYDDNATVEDPVGSEIRRGKASIREFYAGNVAAGARLELAGPVRASALSNELAFAFAAVGEGWKLDVIDTFSINEDGKIAAMRAYWNAGQS